MKKAKVRERLVEVVVAPTVKQTKSRVKQCGFCKHFYIQPCDDKAKGKCPNYLFLISKTKKGKR